MSNETKSVETSLSQEAPMSITMGDPLDKPEVITGNVDGISQEATKRPKEEKLIEEAEGDPEDDENLDGEADGDDEDQEEDTKKTEDDLGDFDTKDVEKWDQSYKKDGELNLNKFGEEWWANVDPETGLGKLNEGTYSYLKSMGIGEEAAKGYEGYIIQQASQERNGYAELAGSEEALQGALQWGRDGGYTKTQMARFNTVMTGNDREAKDDAITALMSRQAKGSPKPGKGPKPKRDVTNSAKTSNKGQTGFANREEYREAKSKAKTQAERRAITERRQLSDF